MPGVGCVLGGKAQALQMRSAVGVQGVETKDPGSHSLLHAVRALWSNRPEYVPVEPHEHIDSSTAALPAGSIQPSPLVTAANPLLVSMSAALPALAPL